MDLQTRKITFVQEFLRLQNEEIISGLENLLRKKKSEIFEEKLMPMSIDEFNLEIDQAMKDSKEGRLSTSNELKEKIKKYNIMKALNLLNLYNAEIKKSMLSKIRGGADIKCTCGSNAPSVSIYAQAPGGDTICLCPDGPNYNSTKNKTGNH